MNLKKKEKLIKKNVEELLAQMSLEEKLGQMSQHHVKVIPPDLEEDIKKQPGRFTFHRNDFLLHS